CFKDRAIEKEILNLQVFCHNQGCTWSGPLRELEEKHRTTCEQKPLRCPFNVVGCTEMVPSHKVHEHNQASMQQHLYCVLQSLQGLVKQAGVSSEGPVLAQTIGRDKGRGPKSDGDKEPWRDRAEEELKVKVQTFENIVTVLNREVGETLNAVLAQERSLKEQEAVTAQLKSKVTFKLLDQSERRQHVVSAFKPDVNSASFRKPAQPMNVASGCPEFLTLAQLRANWRGFVADEVMFIKVIVEP
ncbi:hypothetical protein scyTo_0016025, partial [Scyliorhinus torazame]|nr:hypothetical protein [Scyliorhinus torazame]